MQQKPKLNKTDSMIVLDDVLERKGTVSLNDVITYGLSRNAFYSFIKDKNLVKEKSGQYAVMEDYSDRYKLAQERYPKIIYSWATAIELQQATENISGSIYASIPRGYKIRTNSMPKDFVFIKEDPDTHGIGAKEVETYEGEVVTAYSLERCFCDFVGNRYFSINHEQYYKFLRDAAINDLIDKRKTFDIAKQLGLNAEVYHTLNLILG